ncbi:MAG: GGDEF domain-containing protein [Lachnospiraceae bacterium]|nr:GGDEF domain-containing protein [Lachnospiraceae bacterium]
MEKILYCEIMIVCIMVLSIIYYSDVKSTRGPLLIGQRVFRLLLTANMGAMLFDVLGVIYNGTSYGYSRTMVIASTFIYYFFHSVVGVLFLLYVDFCLYPNKRRFKRRLPYYLLPTIVINIINIINLKTGWYYAVSENNTYQRGDFFIIPTLVCLCYVVYSEYLTFTWWSRNKADYKSHRELYMRLSVIPIIPCVGSVLQALIPGSASTLPFTALALLINYIAIQNGQMAKDHLTGLYNRIQLETFMNYQIRNLKEGKYFFLILLDLDRFKAINDTYGHIVGDDALIQMAAILRSNCKRKKDYVSRLGGDEFVIIGQCREPNGAEVIIERLQKAVEEFNATANKVYKLEFSAGYTLCERNSSATLDTLINEADEKMYYNKNKKKMREKKPE